MGARGRKEKEGLGAKGGMGKGGPEKRKERKGGEKGGEGGGEKGRVEERKGRKRQDGSGKRKAWEERVEEREPKQLRGAESPKGYCEICTHHPTDSHCQIGSID